MQVCDRCKSNVFMYKATLTRYVKIPDGLDFCVKNYELCMQCALELELRNEEFLNPPKIYSKD